jgi:hypothetical protein
MADLLEFFTLHPEIAKELYLWASEIVDDFDDYGPVVQSDEEGHYDESTTLGKLRIVRDSIVTAIEDSSGSLEHLGRPIPLYPWRRRA